MKTGISEGNAFALWDYEMHFVLWDRPLWCDLNDNAAASIEINHRTSRPHRPPKIGIFAVKKAQMHSVAGG